MSSILGPGLRFHTPIVVLALAAVLALPSLASAQTETVEYYGLDALGSVRVIFDGQGNLVDRMDYGPFGENLRAAIKFPVEQFAQLARDAETGQDYAQARNYSPGTGRFNRVDPIYAGLFDPQMWNRYNYVLNNPASVTDPTGLCAAAHCFDWGTVNVFGGPPIPLRGAWTAGTDDQILALPEVGLIQPGDAVGAPLITTPVTPVTGSPDAPPACGDVTFDATSLVPVYGPARSAMTNFDNGSWGWGLFDTAMAVSDLAVVKGAISGLLRGAWKTGSHSWSATRKWYGATRDLAPGTQVHHWVVAQNSSIGRTVPDAVKNQPWNLMPMPSQAVHSSVHGLAPGNFGPAGRLWNGTPGWGKAAATSSVGRAVVAGACQ